MSTETTARYNRILLYPRPEKNRISEILLVKIQNATSPQRIQPNLTILDMKNEKNNDVQRHFTNKFGNNSNVP